MKTHLSVLCEALVTFLAFHQQIGDAVVALHPEYPYRYGPALVQKQGANFWYNLVFYDGIVVDAPREEMYYLDKDIAEEVKQVILGHEDKWVGHAVVVRKNGSGSYALGKFTYYFI